MPATPAAVTNPANLHSNYGLADYNVKQNTTMAFVYQLPSYGSGIWKAITGGFETSGGVFHQTGLPYSVTQSLTSVAGGGSTFANGSVLLLAHQLNNNFDHHCGGGSHALLPDGTAPNQCNFVNSFAPPTNFTQQSRNSLSRSFVHKRELRRIQDDWDSALRDHEVEARRAVLQPLQPPELPEPLSHR